MGTDVELDFACAKLAALLRLEAAVRRREERKRGYDEAWRRLRERKVVRLEVKR